VRCGGNWKRDYGYSYTGTQGETPDTAKEPPTDLPRQFPTLPAYVKTRKRGMSSANEAGSARFLACSARQSSVGS